MWVKGTITVSGDRDNSVDVVKAFFETSSRWKHGVLGEVGHTFSKRRRGGIATGGVERFEVEVRPSDQGPVALEVMSQSGPLYDWGRNKKHIREFVRFLEASGMKVAVGPMTATHRIWREGLGGSGV